MKASGWARKKRQILGVIEALIENLDDSNVLFTEQYMKDIDFRPSEERRRELQHEQKENKEIYKGLSNEFIQLVQSL
jgi:hypothetical protein